MNKQHTIRRPSRGTGNAGMPIPYGQGFMSGAAGELYSNIYDQPGEEEAAVDYCDGWMDGRTHRLNKIDYEE